VNCVCGNEVDSICLGGIYCPATAEPTEKKQTIAAMTERFTDLNPFTNIIIIRFYCTTKLNADNFFKMCCHIKINFVYLQRNES